MSQFSQEELREIRRACFLDPVKFCKTFLSHWFSGEIPWVHRGLMAILIRDASWLPAYGEMAKIQSNFIWKEQPDDPDSPTHPMFVFSGEKWRIVGARFSCFMLPRGYAKTTLCNAMVLRSIVYNATSFSLYVSESSTHAETQLNAIKDQLGTNARLGAVYGQLKPALSSELIWRADQIETTNGVSIAARGRGGQVRGLLHKGARPDTIIADDLEDLESVQSEDQRRKVSDWAFQELMPCLPALNSEASFIALGTLLHRDALMTKFAVDPQFTSVVFGARDLQGDLLWRENMDEEKLELKKRSAIMAGKLAGYYMEYFNELRLGDEAAFKPEFLRHGPPLEPMKTAIAADPAISSKKGSSKAAQAVVGIGEVSGRIWVLETWSKLGASTREQIDQFFLMSKRWKCSAHGVESIAFQAALIHLIQEEMFRKKQYLGEITPITHQQRKEERISGVLQPRYASGYVTHRIHEPELEAQLLDFPSGSMDILDAVAMAVTLLDPWAAHAAGGDLSRDEYEPLEMAGACP